MSDVTKISCNVCLKTLPKTRSTPCISCCKRHHIKCGCARKSGGSFKKQQNTSRDATIENIEENPHNVDTSTQAAELHEFLAKFKTDLTTLFDEKLTDLTSKLDSIAKVVNEIPALTNTIFGLRDSLDAIEKKLKDHDELLDELKTNQQTVVNQTTTFNNVLVSAIENGSNVTAITEDDVPVEVSPTSDANTSIHTQTVTHTPKHKRKRRRKRTRKQMSLHEDSHDSCSSISLDSSVDAEGVGEETNELIVSGIIDCASANVKPRDVAFEILHTVHPDLTIDDIVSAKQFSSKCENQGKSATVAATHASHTDTHSNANKQTCRDLQCSGPTPPILVSLANKDLVQTVLRKKRDFKAFFTNNLNLDALGEVGAISVPPSRIYIGENLPSHKYNEFKELRSAAKRLGFEFVWHRAGIYYVRYAEGERAFSLTCIEDLEVIARTLYTRTANTDQ